MLVYYKAEDLDETLFSVYYEHWVGTFLRKRLGHFYRLITSGVIIFIYSRDSIIKSLSMLT